MPKVLPEYKQEARKRIIDGAMKTFFKLGYQKAKMTDIGKTLGVSKGAIYQYFKSKEELFIEVFDLLITQRRTKILEYLEKNGLEGIKSEKYFELYLIAQNASLAFNVDLISEFLTNERLNENVTNFCTQAVTNTELFFEEHKKKGIIKKDVDSREKALEMLGMLEGLDTLRHFGVSIEEIILSSSRFCSALSIELLVIKNRNNKKRKKEKKFFLNIFLYPIYL